MSAGALHNELPTFGVEIEFLVATLRQNEEDPHGFVEGIPPVLRVPRSFQPSGYAWGKIQDVLDECFGKSQEDGLLTLSVLNKYREWSVDSDSSLLPTRGDLYNKYTWVEVEVVSPVQYGSPKGFEAVNLAISLITSRFRCHVNRSCGVHVHVGLGADRISLEQLKRFATLSYAVEPLLYTLQHPEREINMNCKTLRYFSNLAHSSAELDNAVPHNNPEFRDEKFHCITHLGQERRHGEERLLVREMNNSQAYVDAFLETRQAGHYEPFTQPGDSRHTTLLLGDLSEELDRRISRATLPSSSTTSPVEPARQRGIPRLRLPKYSQADLASMNYRNNRWGASISSNHIEVRAYNNPGPSVAEATERIYSQPSTCNVAQLLHSAVGDQRSGSSFHHYRCFNFEPFMVSGRTIEMRMGEGSLCGEWVSTWAKIITGLFKFALHSSPSVFMDVLENCGRATTVGGYDVVDLLDDIGLFAEAVIVEKRLSGYEDEWGGVEFEELEA
ncbi:putative amidoligase enzyme-domain-containing protein [Xylaria telfairii]|nr:putative amidoligase enzyme-domain-containing protein [Xylaria telfairii]